MAKTNTKPSAAQQTAADLKAIAQLVRNIDRESNANEYTDTDAVWSVLYQIRGIANRARRRIEHAAAATEKLA
jgi:hypothetical protein